MPKILQCTVTVFAMIMELYLIYGGVATLINVLTYEARLMYASAFMFIVTFV